MKKQYLVLVAFILALVGTTHAQYKLYEEGLTKYKEKDYEGSIAKLTDFLSRSIRDKKFDIDAHYYRALSFYKSNSYSNAIEDFDEAILLDHPNKGNIYWFKAKCQAGLNNIQDAIGDYTRALKELETDKQTKCKLLFERSQLHSKKGDLTSAYTDLQSAKAAYPGNADVNKELEKLEKQNVASRGAQQEAVQKPVQKNKKEDKPERKETGQQMVTAPKVTEPPITKPVASQEVIVQQTPAPVSATPTLADLYKDERRFALVIGNSNYPKQIGMLRNPVNDATDMAKELEKSNFKVQLLTDATYGQMRAALLKFKEMVDAGERDKTVSLFYYAGHGLQQDSENFLVPIDAMIEFEDDIARYCFPVQRMVLANMERSNSRINIVILDACRNNPFPALTRSLGDQGLGEMKRARGSFIAYATAPGSVASDGNGRNGLYTQELLKAMRKPGATIEQVFKDVRQNVLRMSGDRQNTWDSSNIIGEFYFKF
jgi:tetratricopeptide (TPR) repeat protein